MIKYSFIFYSLSLILVASGFAENKIPSNTDQEIRNQQKGKQTLKFEQQKKRLEESIFKIKNRHIPLNGTAVAIGPNIFLTNFHILLLMLGEGPMTNITIREDSVENITLQKENSFFYFHEIDHILAVSALHDLVLFSTKDKVSAYLNIEEIPLSINEKVFALGYPQGRFTAIRKISDVVDKEHRLLFPSDRLKNMGSSGSPLLNEEEKIVGLVSSGSGNMLDIIKLESLRKFIKGGGQNCLHFESLKGCIEQEIKNLENIAESGDRFAQYELAKLYHWGLGLEKDRQQAFKWYKLSAEQGYPPSQTNLSSMYKRGRGTEQNLELSSYWMEKATEQGFFLAQYKLSTRYFKNQNFDLAFPLMQQSAKQGFIPAMSELAEMYSKGLGTEQNLELGSHWSDKWISALQNKSR